MDLYFSKKEIKKFKKLGLSDEQIEQHRIDVLTKYIIDTCCQKVSIELNRNLICGLNNYNNKALFLVTKKGRYCELYIKPEEILKNFDNATFLIKEEIKNRFYYVE